MLDCTHIPFNALRTTAQNCQAVVGRQLAEKYSHDEDMQHFVQQLCYASWTASPNFSRIWLGTWSMHTLQQILEQPMNTSMTMKQRYTYTDLPVTDPFHPEYSEDLVKLSFEQDNGSSDPGIQSTTGTRT
jgi:hypothetical protein